MVRTFVILDDLIDSGTTMNEILEALEGRGLLAKKCVGIVLTQNNRGTVEHRFSRFEIPVIDVDNPDYSGRTFEFEDQYGDRVQPPANNQVSA